MGTKTAKKPRRKTVENTALSRGESYTLASCVECSVLVAFGSMGCVDIPLRWRDEATGLAGVAAVLGQGFGIKNGGLHLCPPTRTVDVEIIL